MAKLPYFWRCDVKQIEILETCLSAYCAIFIGISNRITTIMDHFLITVIEKKMLLKIEKTQKINRK